MANQMTKHAFKSHVMYYLKQLLKDPVHTTLDSVMTSWGLKNPDFLDLLIKNAIIAKQESINNKGGAEQFIIRYKVLDNTDTKLNQLYDALKQGKINESVFANEAEMKEEILNDESSGKDYKARGGIKDDDDITESTDCGSSGQFSQPLFGMMKRSIYINERQAEKLKAYILKEEAELDTAFGDFGYDAPIGDGKKNKKNKFFAGATARHNGKGGSISIPKERV